LASLIAAWHRLAPAIRSGIVAIVNASKLNNPDFATR
jgi:hypothetical protein